MASKLKSSYTDTSTGKIDPDAWVSSKDKRLMLQGWDHDGRWVEIIMWDGRAPESVGQFAVTIYDRQTGKSVAASDAQKTIALAQAKAKIGMP